MLTFKDRHGREWDLSLDMGGARRIDKSDFSLLTKTEFSIIEARKENFAELLKNHSLLFAVIWALVVPQAKKKHQAYLRWLASLPKETDPNEESPPIPPTCFPYDPEAQAEEAELEFVSGINGQAKEAGLETFWKSLGGFFPELETGLSLMYKQYQRAKAKLSERVPELEQDFQKEIDIKIQAGLDEMRKNMKALNKKTGEGSSE